MKVSWDDYSQSIYGKTKKGWKQPTRYDKLQQYHEYTKKRGSHTDQNVKSLGLHLINYLVCPEYRRLNQFRKHLQQMEVVMVT